MNIITTLRDNNGGASGGGGWGGGRRPGSAEPHLLMNVLHVPRGYVHTSQTQEATSFSVFQSLDILESVQAFTRVKFE